MSLYKCLSFYELSFYREIRKLSVREKKNVLFLETLPNLLFEVYSKFETFEIFFYIFRVY